MRRILESLDILSGVLISPSGTFEEIRSKRPVVLAMVTAIATAVVFGLVVAPNPPELAEVMFDINKGTLSIWGILPLWVCLFMSVVCTQIVFVHFTARLLKGKGSFSGIFCGLCFAYLPGVLAAPLMMLRALISSDRGNAFYQVAFPFLCLWIFILGVTAVRHNYGMSALKALSVCSVAFAVLVVLPFVVATIAMTQVMT